MCFGNQTTSTTDTTGTSNQTGQTSANSNTTGNTNQSTLGTTAANSQASNASSTSAVANPFVAQSAVGNLGFVNNLQATGFQGYTGQQVAGLTPGQQGTIDSATDIANNGTGAAASKLIGGYASSPASSVTPQSIASNMSPYMSQYVMQALAPQLRQMDVANAATNNATNANATGSGAFGDARTGIEQANNSFNQNVAREGLIGNAYNSAFNTAIGAGAQDSANNLTGQTTNANLNEQALQRSLGGAQALEGLQTQQQGAQSTANALNQQDTATNQANLTAQYNQWLMAQQYPFQTAALANSTIGTAANALPASTNTVGTAVGSNTGQTTGTTTGTSSSNTAASGTSASQGQTTGTSTTQQPNNSGLGLLGSLAGPALTLAFSDRRLKSGISIIGGLHDGTPVYSFHYKADPAKRTQIGLMAQDVKKRRPDAVHTLDDPDGTMMVDYAKATALSRSIGAAI